MEPINLKEENIFWVTVAWLFFPLFYLKGMWWINYLHNLFSNPDFHVTCYLEPVCSPSLPGRWLDHMHVRENQSAVFRRLPISASFWLQTGLRFTFIPPRALNPAGGGMQMRNSGGMGTWIRGIIRLDQACSVHLNVLLIANDSYLFIKTGFPQLDKDRAVSYKSSSIESLRYPRILSYSIKPELMRFDCIQTQRFKWVCFSIFLP